MRYVVIDTETTALAPENGTVIEFSALVDDTAWWDRDVDTLPHISFFVAGNYRVVGEIGTIAFNARLFEEMHRAMNTPVPEGTMNPVQPPGNVANVFFRFLQSNGYEASADGRISFNVAGKNIMGFDYQFLRHLPSWTDKLKVRHRSLDPAILFSEETDEKLPDLQTCVERSGVDVGEVPHRAYGDNLITAAVLRRGLMNLWDM